MNDYTPNSRENQSARQTLQDILSRLENVKQSGSGYTARCPAHDDEHNSLSISISENGRQILLHCFAGCTTEAVVGALGMTMRDLFIDESHDNKKPRKRVKAVKVRVGGVKVRVGGVKAEGVTVADLAREKRIAEDFLKSLGLHDIRLYGVPAVAIPYYDEAGGEIATRYRIALQGDRFRWKKGSATSLYGLERLSDARRAGWVLIVEGESDCWTAWYRGVPAVGVPGKSNWKSEWKGYLEDLKVYVWQEPDAEDFTLRIARDLPDSLVIRSEVAGAKDISEAHCAGQDIKELLERLKAEAIPAHEIIRRHTFAEISRLEKEAAKVLQADDPLALIEAAIRDSGYGGDTDPVLISYLCATTRLLTLYRGQMPSHLLLMGPSSSGKSYTMQTALRLLPNEAYHTIDAGSPRVLIYDDADIQHKVVVFSEIDSLPEDEDNPAASAIRNLLQDGYLHYAVVVKDPRTGKYVTEEVEKPGPSVLLTTATKEPKHQLGTRLFSLAVPEDAQRIRDALAAQARVEIEGVPDPDPALIAYQAYLQRLAPFDVIVPFADALADLIGRSANATRILRDFPRLLSIIKAVTILRHRHRAKSAEGRLVATLADYEVVFRLVNDMYSVSITGVTDQIKAVVDAVRELRQERQDRVSYSRVAQRVGLHLEQVRRLCRQAIRHGWLTNAETKQGLPADLNVGDPIPEREGLPTPQEIEEMMQGGGITKDTLVPDELLSGEPLPAEEPVTPAPPAPLQLCLPDVGDKVWLLKRVGLPRNTTPWEIVDIVETPSGEKYALFREINTGWPLERCRLAARIGDKVMLLNNDGTYHNEKPLVIDDIFSFNPFAEDEEDEEDAYKDALFMETDDIWPLVRCVVVERGVGDLLPARESLTPLQENAQKAQNIGVEQEVANVMQSIERESPYLPDIGDKVWLIKRENGKAYNAEPWEIQDIAPGPHGEPWALFKQKTMWGDGWPLKQCVIVERARRKTR